MERAEGNVKSAPVLECRGVGRTFESYEKTALGQWETKLYKNGVKLRPEQTGIKDLSEDKLYRVYGSDNSFLGIGTFHEGSFRSFKNF